MSITTALARGRALAESLMQDACMIQRKTGETTSGGVVTPTWAQVYAGPCRVQVRSVREGYRDVGEAARVVQRPELQLPAATTGIREGDRVTMTAAADPELATPLRVTDTVTQS